MGEPLWKISTLSPLTNRFFYRLELPFTKYNIIKHFLWTCFPKKEIISKVLFFNKNHCLRINFLTFYKCTFFSSKMVCLLLSTSLNTFSTPNLLTIIKKLDIFPTNNGKFAKFWPKPKWSPIWQVCKHEVWKSADHSQNFPYQTKDDPKTCFFTHLKHS